MSKPKSSRYTESWWNFFQFALPVVFFLSVSIHGVSKGDHWAVGASVLVLIITIILMIGSLRTLKRRLKSAMSKCDDLEQRNRSLENGILTEVRAVQGDLISALLRESLSEMEPSGVEEHSPWAYAIGMADVTNDVFGIAQIPVADSFHDALVKGVAHWKSFVYARYSEHFQWPPSNLHRLVAIHRKSGEYKLFFGTPTDDGTYTEIDPVLKSSKLERAQHAVARANAEFNSGCGDGESRDEYVARQVVAILD